MEAIRIEPRRIWRYHEIRLAAAVVLAHLIVMFVHGIAHAELRVELSLWGSLFVASVVAIGPVAGLGLCWSGSRRQGGTIFGATMAGAFVFGLWNHFLWPGTDHVAHLPSARWRLPFEVTAWLLLATEAAGVVLGLVLRGRPTGVLELGESAAARRSGS